jgi:hypothetical protein
LSVVAALLLAAGCAGSGEGEGRTGPTPPDRLTVVAEGGGIPRLRFELDCAIADRAVCVPVLDALRRANDDADCAPADGGDRTLTVRGTIDGRRIGGVLSRRTDCEIAAYDAAARALGL